jgi:hypothetical protein
MERPAETDPATEIFPAVQDEDISADALSRWFRTPVAEKPAPKSVVDVPAAEPEAPSLEEPSTVNGLPKRQRSPEPVAKTEVPTAVPRAVADFAESDWGSAADEGWRAAGALDTGEPAQTTENGLPKRVPKARLVPGSSPKASSPVPQLATAGVSGRSAERLRQRFATYQKGVQMGRESLFDSSVGGIPVIAEREHQ